MKKVVAIFLLLFATRSSVVAQLSQRTLDSLQQELSIAAQDTSRVLIIMQLCTFYQFSKPDSALFYAYKGLALSRQIKFAKGEANILQHMATAEGTLGNDSRALQLILQGIKVADEGNIVDIKGILMMQLGQLYRRSNNFEKTLSLLRESKVLLDLVRDSAFSAIAQNYIGETFLAMNRLDSAQVYAESAHELSVPLRRPWVTYRVLLTLGQIQQAKGNYDLALGYFRQSLATTVTRRGFYNVNYAIARLYRQMDKPDSCIQYAKKSLQIAQEAGFYSDIIEASVLLSDSYEDHNSDQALFYSKLALASKDSLFRLGKSTTLKGFVDLDEQERKQELEAAKAEYNERLKMNVLLGGTFTLVVIAFFLFRNYRYKQKARERELEHAREIEKVKSAFFTNISHEFRTPLTLINGHVSMMAEAAKDSTMKDGLRQIERHGNVMLKLINRLLDLAKLESGNLSVDMSEDNLTHFLSVLVGSFSSLAWQKNISMEMTLPVKQCVALFDKEKLETIVNNLISNAIKFTPESGRVIVVASIGDGNGDMNAGESTMEVVVKDSGIGIASGEQTKIFSRFYQLNESHEEIGTGIGLALVKELTELMGGKITLESEPGKGSTFKVILPIHIKQVYENEDVLLPDVSFSHVDQQTLLPLAENGVHERPKLLVVEDNADLVKFIVFALGTDYDFLEARDGKQGLAVAFEEIPDLIISDVMMPEIDGVTMTDKLKGDLRTSHIPVILLTAKTSVENKLTGLASGADDYLTKPFNRHELALKIRNTIASRYKIRQRLRLELLQEGPRLSAVSADERFLVKVKESHSSAP